MNPTVPIYDELHETIEGRTFDRMLDDSIKRHPKVTAHLHESERGEQSDGCGIGTP